MWPNIATLFSFRSGSITGVALIGGVIAHSFIHSLNLTHKKIHIKTKKPHSRRNGLLPTIQQINQPIPPWNEYMAMLLSRMCLVGSSNTCRNLIAMLRKKNGIRWKTFTSLYIIHWEIEKETCERNDCTFFFSPFSNDEITAEFFRVSFSTHRRHMILTV